MAGNPEELSIYHPAGYLQLPSGQMFGKDVANHGLFSALARHGGYRRFNVLHQSQASVADLLPQFFPPGGHQGLLETGTPWNTDLPRRSGTLLRGQPYLSELAWLRRTARCDTRYSLVGLIHTLAPPFIRSQMGAAALAPVHPWDALICTSPSVQEALERMFTAQEEWLKERLGADRRPRPQLPLIPLGVDAEACAAHRDDAAGRAALRSQLNLADDDVMVLWVGRLSYFEKAFPQAMLQAVQQAAGRTNRRLALVLAGWFANGEADQRLYIQAAQQLAPSVPVMILNGSNPRLLARAWAAADVFLSLVDNIQETFGLAPVEAMAAGLPVVVSDWDGYRFTVRDGLDGFRIPTLGSPGGAPGEMLAHLHSLRLQSYQTYAGAVAQHTAVHVGRAADALAQLAQSPELRRRMGDAGQQRARALFDWPVVVGRYNALFSSLAERREQALHDQQATVSARIQPCRGDPFADFQGFASSLLQPDLRLRLVDGVTPADLQRLLTVDLHRVYPGLRGSRNEAADLLEQLQAAPNGLTVSELLDAAQPERRPFLETTLVWLAKLGLIDWLDPCP